MQDDDIMLLISALEGGMTLDEIATQASIALAFIVVAKKELYRRTVDFGFGKVIIDSAIERPDEEEEDEDDFDASI